MTSRAGVKPDSSTAFRVAAEVTANPGLEVHELARRIGWTVRHCSKALTGAKNGGLVDISRNQQRARWYSAQLIGSIRAQEKQERHARELVLHRSRNERRKWKRIAIEADESGSDLSDTPIRTIVPAGAPLPFVCRAVRSVFDLGAA